MQVATENLGKLTFNFLTKNRAPILHKVRLTRCSEVLTDAPYVLLRNFREPTWNCTVKIAQVGGAASKKENYAGENDVVHSSLFVLGWSLRGHQEQL